MRRVCMHCGARRLWALRLVVALLGLVLWATGGGPASAGFCYDLAGRERALEDLAAKACAAGDPESHRTEIEMFLNGALDPQCGTAADGLFHLAPGHYVVWRNYTSSLWFKVGAWVQDGRVEADRTSPSAAEVVSRRDRLAKLIERAFTPKKLSCAFGTPEASYNDMHIFGFATDGARPLKIGLSSGDTEDGVPVRHSGIRLQDLDAYARLLKAIEAGEFDGSQMAPSQEAIDAAKLTKIRGEGDWSESGTQAQPQATDTESQAADQQVAEQPAEANAGEPGQEGSGDATENGSQAGKGEATDDGGFLPPGAPAWLTDLARMVLRYFGIEEYTKFGLMALMMIAPDLVQNLAELAATATEGLASDSLNDAFGKLRKAFELASAVSSAASGLQKAFEEGGVEAALRETAAAIQKMPPEMRKEIEKKLQADIAGFKVSPTDLANAANVAKFIEDGGLETLGDALENPDKITNALGERLKEHAIELGTKKAVELASDNGIDLPEDVARNLFEGEFDQAASGVKTAMEQKLRTEAEMLLNKTLKDANFPELSSGEMADILNGNLQDVADRRAQVLIDTQIDKVRRKVGLNDSALKLLEAAQSKEPDKALLEAVRDQLPDALSGPAEILLAPNAQAREAAARSYAAQKLQQDLGAGVAQALRSGADLDRVAELSAIQMARRVLGDRVDLDGITSLAEVPDRLKAQADAAVQRELGRLGPEGRAVLGVIQGKQGALKQLEGLATRRALDEIGNGRQVFERLILQEVREAVAKLPADVVTPQFMQSLQRAQSVADLAEAIVALAQDQHERLMAQLALIQPACVADVVRAVRDNGVDGGYAQAKDCVGDLDLRDIAATEITQGQSALRGVVANKLVQTIGPDAAAALMADGPVSARMERAALAVLRAAAPEAAVLDGVETIDGLKRRLLAISQDELVQLRTRLAAHDSDLAKAFDLFRAGGLRGGDALTGLLARRLSKELDAGRASLEMQALARINAAIARADLPGIADDIRGRIARAETFLHLRDTLERGAADQIEAVLDQIREADAVAGEIADAVLRGQLDLAWTLALGKLHALDEAALRDIAGRALEHGLNRHPEARILLGDVNDVGRSLAEGDFDTIGKQLKARATHLISSETEALRRSLRESLLETARDLGIGSAEADRLADAILAGQIDALAQAELTQAKRILGRLGRDVDGMLEDLRSGRIVAAFQTHLTDKAQAFQNMATGFYSAASARAALAALIRPVLQEDGAELGVIADVLDDPGLCPGSCRGVVQDAVQRRAARLLREDFGLDMAALRRLIEDPEAEADIVLNRLLCGTAAGRCDWRDMAGAMVSDFNISAAKALGARDAAALMLGNVDRRVAMLGRQIATCGLNPLDQSNTDCNTGAKVKSALEALEVKIREAADQGIAQGQRQMQAKIDAAVKKRLQILERYRARAELAEMCMKLGGVAELPGGQLGCVQCPDQDVNTHRGRRCAQ